MTHDLRNLRPTVRVSGGGAGGVGVDCCGSGGGKRATEFSSDKKSRHVTPSSFPPFSPTDGVEPIGGVNNFF